jgi:hemerythrin superfamily protein
MSLLNKVMSAVTPPESDDDRAEARLRARAAAGSSGWLKSVLDHHLLIEDAFATLQTTANASFRKTAQKRLAVILAAHSTAEESVIYPALALTGQTGAADQAYAEQSQAKVGMAALEGLDPMSQAYLDKLEEIRLAVAHHAYEEESAWFPELRRQGDAALQARLTRRYKEEFSRYVGEAANTD